MSKGFCGGWWAAWRLIARSASRRLSAVSNCFFQLGGHKMLDRAIWISISVCKLLIGGRTCCWLTLGGWKRDIVKNQKFVFFKAQMIWVVVCYASSFETFESHVVAFFCWTKYVFSEISTELWSMKKIEKSHLLEFVEKSFNIVPAKTSSNKEHWVPMKQNL